LELFRDAIAEFILLNYLDYNIYDKDEYFEGNEEKVIINLILGKDLFLSFPCFDSWPWRELWL